MSESGRVVGPVSAGSIVEPVEEPTTAARNGALASIRSKSTALHAVPTDPNGYIIHNREGTPE